MRTDLTFGDIHKVVVLRIALKSDPPKHPNTKYENIKQTNKERRNTRI